MPAAPPHEIRAPDLAVRRGEVRRLVELDWCLEAAVAAQWSPLLRERRCLRKGVPEQLWRSLRVQGWKPLKKPAWGAAAEPLRSPSVVAQGFS